VRKFVSSRKDCVVPGRREDGLAKEDRGIVKGKGGKLESVPLKEKDNRRLSTRKALTKRLCISETVGRFFRGFVGRQLFLLGDV